MPTCKEKLCDHITVISDGYAEDEEPEYGVEFKIKCHVCDETYTTCIGVN